MDQVDRILDQWRAARPDLDVVPMGTIGRMKRLTAHLVQGMERVFSAHSLNAASFDVLATLRRAGAPYELTPSELIEWSMVTSGTMTNRLDRLEAAGFITRHRNPEDGRGFLIGLTEKGRKLIDEAVTAHVENQHAMIEVLNENERKTLDRLLGKWLGTFE
ncbi:MarR family transcriptional regulator [uncultured Parvibaculum sp.]|uniref:MarR family winged helix-turn-helix transcriptional regulator n=2 Tax=Parvibaculum TaxID=256616 RepID=UPI0030D917C5